MSGRRVIGTGPILRAQLASPLPPLSATSSCHVRDNQSASIEGVDRYGGFVAGVDCCSQLGSALSIKRETGGKENQHLAARDRAKILRQAANGQEHSPDAVVGFSAADGGKSGGSNNDGLRGALPIGLNIRST